MKKEKRIPTILGIILLFGSIIGGVVLSSQKMNIGSKAGGDCVPINPQITNITNNSFNVSFTTTNDCLSTINVDNRSISDLRFINTDRKETASKIHYFEVNNLKENSTYTFSFINNGTYYTHNNYKAQTAQKPATQIPTSNLAWGRVFTPDLKPATEAILYLNTQGASPLSAFITSKGHWNISLAISFNDSKNDWFTPPNNQIEDIVVIAPDNQITQITSNTSRNNPVPDIILGQNQFSETPVADYTTGELNQIGLTSPSLIDKNLTIDNPKENEPVFTLRPDFFGQGPANTLINIQINSSTPIKSQTTTLNDGTWHWSPLQDLTPGSQTVTVSSVNRKTNSTDTVIRNFTIISPDNGVGMAFSASSSAKIQSIAPTQTPTPTLIPSPTSKPGNITAKTTNTPTPTPTKKPTAAPTLTPTPTVRIPTTIPTLKPTVARTTNSSTTSAMPTSGVSTPTAILVSLSLIFIIAACFIL